MGIWSCSRAQSFKEPNSRGEFWVLGTLPRGTQGLTLRLLGAGVAIKYRALTDRSDKPVLQQVAGPWPLLPLTSRCRVGFSLTCLLGTSVPTPCARRWSEPGLDSLLTGAGIRGSAHPATNRFIL